MAQIFLCDKSNSIARFVSGFLHVVPLADLLWLCSFTCGELARYCMMHFLHKALKKIKREIPTPLRILNGLQKGFLWVTGSALK